VIVFAVYWLMPYTKYRHVTRKALLLVASYYFYMSWNVKLVSLIAASTALDYTVGLILESSTSRRVRRGALIASLVGNLGLLATFKYANFFVDSAVVLGQRIGLHLTPVELNIVLPVGISFYTFQTLSYTIDVYRGKLPTCRNLLDFSLFVAFFPQLVAGPIVRAADFLPQLGYDKTWDRERLRRGLRLTVVGLAKKVVVADSVAIIADAVFADPGSYGLVGTWLGVVAFAVQIYCDFSGYSDVAIGVAAMLGYDIPKNFAHPYIAQSIREFWRRWHISLSTWLRDYLYIPLGGNRHGELLTYRNLMLTMVLGGLWHGAAWTFVAWGVYQGLMLSATRLGERRFPRLTGVDADVGLPVAAARMAVTFVFVCFGWVLFRAQSFSDALHLSASMAGLNGMWGEGALRLRAAWLFVPVVFGHLAAFVKERYGVDLMQPLVVRAAIITGAVVGILAFWDDPSSFIYFQF
jgi:D-alanyl-lipoteichoic acid acyltransferase DltB (MBOAT superfamily)